MSEQTSERTLDGGLLAARVEYCGSDVAKPRSARRPNVIVLAFHAIPRRSALASAVKLDKLISELHGYLRVAVFV